MDNIFNAMVSIGEQWLKAGKNDEKQYFMYATVILGTSLLIADPLLIALTPNIAAILGINIAILSVWMLLCLAPCADIIAEIASFDSVWRIVGFVLAAHVYFLWRIEASVGMIGIVEVVRALTKALHHL